MDAINRFGTTLFNQFLPDWFRTMSSDQKHRFKVDWRQVGKQADLNLDWRLTANPVIHDHELDLDFYFDIGASENHCSFAHEDFEVPFEPYNSDYMQFVLSDRVINCFLDALER